MNEFQFGPEQGQEPGCAEGFFPGIENRSGRAKNLRRRKRRCHEARPSERVGAAHADELPPDNVSHPLARNQHGPAR